MLCCVCKDKEAKVHLTQILGEKMQKVDLCEACAGEKGVNDPTGFSLADLLLGLGASTEIDEAGGGAKLKCPECGFTQADFKKAGRLGCARCYDTFSEALVSLLKTMHKGTRHVGKAPRAFKQSRLLAERLEKLHRKLEKAIESEQFEEAAKVRDEIKSTRAKITDSTTTT